eukprot:5134723-Heterocapsa_arctica.AAC.1
MSSYYALAPTGLRRHELGPDCAALWIRGSWGDNNSHDGSNSHNNNKSTNSRYGQVPMSNIRVEALA